MQNIVIFGDSKYAEQVYEYIKCEHVLNVVAFTNERNFISRENVQGIPVVPFEELRERIDTDFEILVACGYSKMNHLREKLCDFCRAHGYKLGRFISRTAQIYTDPEKIGENVMVYPNAFIGPNVTLEQGAIVSASCSISHDSVIGKFSFFSTGVVVGGSTDFDPYCFVGLHSTVKNSIRIAEESFIGAGANVLHSTEPYGVYVGNPARKIPNKRSTDIENI